MAQVVTLSSKISTPTLVQEKPCYEELFERIAMIWHSVCAWISALASQLFSWENKGATQNLALKSLNCFCHMVRYLEPEDLARCERVAKSWKIDKIWQAQCANYGIILPPESGRFKDLFIVPEMAFGPKEWRKHFGKISRTPPLPVNIKSQIAELGETHTLTLIPKTVNEQPLTFKTFAPLAERVGMKLSMSNYVSEDYGDEAQGKSVWFWMQKDLEPGSRGKTQAQAERDYAGKLGKALSITVSIVAHYARCKICLFQMTSFPETLQRTNTRTCDVREDKYGAWDVVVGEFFSGTLHIGHERGGSTDYIGVALTQ